MTSQYVPEPANDLERRLGFRIEPDEGRESGTVIFFPGGSREEGAVRPAYGTELKLWRELQGFGAWLDAHQVSDPFGTPKAVQEGP